MLAAAGFPVKETWIRAVRAGNYTTRPGLSVKSIQKYCPDDAEETLKGHMRGQRQRFHSKKERREKEPNDNKTLKQKQNDIYTTVIDLKEEIHIDQTGKFPHLSSKGNRYIMVAHNIDANYIFMDTMKNRSESQIMACYQQIVSRMKKAGLTLRKHILDNEASAAYTALIEGNGIAKHGHGSRDSQSRELGLPVT